MNTWLRRIRGALGMGLTWGVGWAAAGLLIGVIRLAGVPMGWFLEVFDAPLPALALPGFFCGVVFSGVLGIAGRRRGFDELSLPGFAVWGAAGGLLMSLVPVVPLLAREPAEVGVAAVAAGTLTALSAASAAASLAIARSGEERGRLGPGAEGPASIPPAEAGRPQRTGGPAGAPERASGRRRCP